MTKSSWSTKFLLVSIISSLVIGSCGASSVTIESLEFQLVPQKTSKIQKAASIASGLFWAVAVSGSFMAIVDAFMNRTKNSKVIQGGIGFTALLVSLYKLGFFEASNNSPDGYCHGCDYDCHNCYDSHNDCSCCSDSSYNHNDCSCCSGHDVAYYDYYEQEYVYEQKPDKPTHVNTVTVEIASDGVVCNDSLTNFWEDPFNY